MFSLVCLGLADGGLVGPWIEISPSDEHAKEMVASLFGDQIGAGLVDIFCSYRRE